MQSIPAEELSAAQKQLQHFITACPTMHNAHAEIEKRLSNLGAKRLEETERWDLSPGGLYYISREQGAIMSFRMGMRSPDETGFRIAAAHTDSPLLKVKPQSIRTMGGGQVLNVEVYGGPILSSWVDRELTLAGSALIKTSGEKSPRLESFSLQHPVAQIPNLAIHLNREINKGFEYNPQTHLQALLFSSIPEEHLSKPLEYLIAEALGIEVTQIIGGDWYLVPSQIPVLYNDHTISSGRIDNLAGCHAVLRSFCATQAGDTTQVAVFYNHEEIGSMSLSGANGQFIHGNLRRICLLSGADEEGITISLAKSFQISVDAAHANHPNYPEKFDPAYPVELGKGPVVKISALQRYATTPVTMEPIRQICEDLGVPFQIMVNRSDVPSGTTIGPLSVSRTDIPTIDIGIPIHAMHSTREIGSATDHHHLIQILTEMYNRNHV